MEKIILFADNTPDFLDTRSEFLEMAGYKVVKAYTLEKTRELLSLAHIHLAILDLRLVNDDDDKDVSGLLLAKEPAFNRIPKVILTDFPTFRDVREALGPVIDNLPPAVGFLAKQEGPEAMVAEVDKIFAKIIQINWDLNIRLGKSQWLSIPGLVGLITEKLPSGNLPALNDELEDLFRKLFVNYEQITLSWLLWRKNDRIALIVFGFKEGRQEQFIVSCGRLQEIREEKQAFKIVDSHTRKTENLNLRLYEETSHFAGIAWTLPMVNLEELQTFSKFFREKQEKQIKSVLDYLFGTMLRPYHQQDRIISESQVLQRLLCARLGINIGAFSSDALTTKVGKLCQESLNLGQGINDINFSCGQLNIRFAGGQAFSFSDPISYLENDDEALRSIKVISTTSLGNLDVDTILVDRENRTWLSDHHHAGVMPIWYDFASFETAIRFNLIEVTNLQVLINFEKQLLAANRFSEVKVPEDIDAELHKAAVTIQMIRRLASEVSDEDTRPYLITLLFCTAMNLATFDSDLHYTHQEIASFLYRLIFSALLCQKIAQLKNPVADPLISQPINNELRVDKINHEVWLGDKQVPISGREFELLIYLYDHKGELCKRADIMRDGFHIENATEDDSLLNTNIDRLRGKIELDPNNVPHIVNVRGVGYKLLV